MDLIVMGTHGRSGLERMLMGSVAEKVMRGASCSVLVVKLPGERQAVSPDVEVAVSPDLNGVACAETPRAVVVASAAATALGVFRATSLVQKARGGFAGAENSVVRADAGLDLIVAVEIDIVVLTADVG